MAISTTTTLNDLYANIVQAALYTLSEQTVIRPLVRNHQLSQQTLQLLQRLKLELV